MRLRQPTDFVILESLADGTRNTGANIARLIDENRGYVNTQLPKLADQGLLTKIGPHENSGLYRITPLGVAAVEHRSLYDEDEEQFETAIRELADDIEIQPPAIVINR